MDPTFGHVLEHFDHDEYSEILNGDKTYESIAKGLKLGHPVVIGWTDEAMSHMDVLFSYDPIQAGYLQRGMKSTDLFVSVSGYGMHGFAVRGTYLDPGYVAEKLNFGGANVTVEKLTELIEAVRNRL